jgi:hypothetical protein
MRLCLKVLRTLQKTQDLWLGRDNMKALNPPKLYELNSLEKSSYQNAIAVKTVKKFSAYYGNRRSITVFTWSRHWPATWTTWIQSSNFTTCSFTIHFIINAPIPPMFLTFPPWLDEHNNVWWKVQITIHLICYFYHSLVLLLSYVQIFSSQPRS